MNTRSSKSIVRFSHPFALSAVPDELPAGDYEIIVEEELLQGLTFEAYRRTGTFLTVRGRGRRAGFTELRPVTESELEAALSRDRMLAGSPEFGEAPRRPQDDPRP